MTAAPAGAPALMLALQRTAGNRAVSRLVGRHLQREGGGKTAAKAPAGVPLALLREAVALESQAIRHVGLLQALIEKVHNERDELERRALLEHAEGLIAGTDAEVAEAERIATAADGADGGHESTVQLLRALATTREIVRAMRGEGADRLRRAAAIARHRRQLEQLARPSTGHELKPRHHERSKAATTSDEDEIQNWVAGGWSTMNQELFGASTDEEREARKFVLETSTVPKDRWAADIDARIGGLSATLAKLPTAKGTTYRRAKYQDLSVWESTIGPGALVGSPGFLATSELKGAEGAGGGGGAWGTGAKVYYEIRGVTGVPLGPYQRDLKGEREVLYPRCAVFEVLAVRIEGVTVFVILSQIGAVPKGVVVRDPYTGKPVDLS